MTQCHSNSIRAVVFDMDGVLIDSHPAHKAAWREFLQSVGHNVSDEELYFVVEGHTRTEILRHFLGNLSESELENYGRYKDDIFRVLKHRIALIAGVPQFLRHLERQGIAMAVATSASEIRTLATLERLGISQFFGAVVTAADVCRGKPDPAVYQLASDRLGIPPQQAIAFDDAPAGIDSAKSAGMRCIGVSSNGMAERLLAAGAEQVIKDFTAVTLDDIARAA